MLYASVGFLGLCASHFISTSQLSLGPVVPVDNSATRHTGSEKRKSREKMKWKTATLPVLCDGNDEVESCGVRADKINTFSVYSASRTRFTSLSLSLCCSENFPFVLKAVPEHRAREWESCVCRAYTLSSRHRRLHRAEQQKHTTMSVLCFMYIFFFAQFLLLLYSPSSSSSFTPSSRGCLKKGGGGRRSGALLVELMQHKIKSEKHRAKSEAKGKAAKSIDRSGEWDRE